MNQSDSQKLPQNNRRKRRLAMVLSTLLIVQLVFFISTLKIWQRSDQYPLLVFDRKKVTKIVIAQREDDERNGNSIKSLILLMTPKSDWLLPDLYDFPASSELVHETLDALDGLRKGYPIGTTDDALERYKVSGQNFRCAISLFEGDTKIGTIFIGTALTIETAAVRSANDHCVYAAEVPSSRITANADYWIDRRATSVKVKKIASIDMGSFRLDNFDEKWNLVEGERKDLLSLQAVESIIYPVANCKIVSVLGKNPDPDFNLQHPTLSFKITLKDKSERSYTVSKARGSGLYVLKISSFPWFCLADQHSIEKIIACTPETLRRQETIAAARRRLSHGKSRLNLRGKQSTGRSL
jgi:hypothetical protein